MSDTSANSTIELEDEEYSGFGGYENPDIPIQASRHEDTEEKELEPFLAAIYAFKLAVNAAYREFYIKVHPSNTRGVDEYQSYIRAIQSLWDTKTRRLRTKLTDKYDILPDNIQQLLQTMLTQIHASNTGTHEFARNYWVRRLFIECAGSSNMRSFEACKQQMK